MALSTPKKKGPEASRHHHNPPHSTFFHSHHSLNLQRFLVVSFDTLDRSVVTLPLFDRSSNSLKARSVQEQVFTEIKTMISIYEERYGTDKLQTIPQRSRQFEQIDKIVESFRKLREGLFATEARDMFAVEVYEQSVLYSLLAGNIPELTKALYHLVQELHPAVYRTEPTTENSTRLVEIPTPRQRFLGLYILYHMAKPIRPNKATVTGDTASQKDSFSQSITHPKTETDELVASLLQVYEQHLCGCSSGLDPELVFALAYWKSLRDGSWIRRERLLAQGLGSSGQNNPVSWDQHLMIRHSVGDSLRSARTISVAAMSKAYYSLSVPVMAQAVGLTSGEQGSAGLASTHVDTTDTMTANDRWLKELQSSFGLSPSIVLTNGQLMLKSKK
ncbi:MAG: hypothetical protein J3Q66DRAFT_60794 [Benniella sp.]|nr:MAG: hypothetical protein J3Q66DRAFT_60794 [Benniella sp.]